jgi:hypothetical protein
VRRSFGDARPSTLLLELRQQAALRAQLEDKPKGAIWPKYCPNEQTIEALMTKLKLPKALHRR